MEYTIARQKKFMLSYGLFNSKKAPFLSQKSQITTIKEIFQKSSEY
jgi:hypothetical protein